MKVTTKEPTTKEEFPCLMISYFCTIVLFTDKDKGTVLSVCDEPYDIGYYSEEWITEGFEPYAGEIIITND
jgi:hypothetical protein|tara:strand:+ start:2062 stop:2274 length:213 start_codon:yes stop_codon:yes gene_type:complete